MIELKYTLCFCILDNDVLMLHRKRNPNGNLWNGLGGKIENDESPEQSLQREMVEEAEIDLAKDAEVQYCGIVSWSYLPDIAPLLGMHLYIARLKNSSHHKNEDKETNEGILKWLPLAWVCDPTNAAVVTNIPIFLTEALKNADKKHYHFIYDGEQIKDVKVEQLSQ